MNSWLYWDEIVFYLRQRNKFIVACIVDILLRIVYLEAFITRYFQSSNTTCFGGSEKGKQPCSLVLGFLKY